MLRMSLSGVRALSYRIVVVQGVFSFFCLISPTIYVLSFVDFFPPEGLDLDLLPWGKTGALDPRPQAPKAAAAFPALVTRDILERRVIPVVLIRCSAILALFPFHALS